MLVRGHRPAERAAGGQVRGRLVEGGLAMPTPAAAIPILP